MMYAMCYVCPMYEYDVYANVYVMIMFMIICDVNEFDDCVGDVLIEW